VKVLEGSSAKLETAAAMVDLGAAIAAGNPGQALGAFENAVTSIKA